MRGLPFFKPKKGAQFAGLGFSDGTGGGGGSYVLPTASAETLGGVKIGSNISIDAGGAISAPDSLEEKATLPTASADELGNRYIYIGETGGGLIKGYVYECVSDGGDPATYSWAPSNVQAPYTLPIASASTLGGVKVGKNLGIDASGILSTKPEFKELTDEESSHVLSGSYHDIKLCVFSNNISVPGIPGGFNFVLAYGDETDGYGFQFLISYSGHILFRRVENHIWQSWQEVAFTS